MNFFLDKKNYYYYIMLEGKSWISYPCAQNRNGIRRLGAPRNPNKSGNEQRGEQVRGMMRKCHIYRTVKEQKGE